MKITNRIFAFVIVFSIMAIAFKPLTSVGSLSPISKIEAASLFTNINFFSDKDISEEENEFEKNLVFFVGFSLIFSLLASSVFCIMVPNHNNGIKAVASHIPVYLRAGKLTL